MGSTRLAIMLNYLIWKIIHFVKSPGMAHLESHSFTTVHVERAAVQKEKHVREKVLLSLKGNPKFLQLRKFYIQNTSDTTIDILAEIGCGEHKLIFKIIIVAILLCEC